MKHAILRQCVLVAAVGIWSAARQLPAQDNVARQGTASQSSNWGGPAQDIFPASNAINGIFTDFSHTQDSQWPAWWQVDLGDFYDLSFIVLYNRGDGCCQSRHRDLTVEIRDSPDDAATVLYTSPLLNPENILGGGGTAGPKFLTLNLPALLGGPVTGAEVVRVTRTPDFDFSGTGGQGNSGEPYLLQLGEVEVYTGDCPPVIAGACNSITVEGPASGGPGLYTVTVVGTGSPLYYTYLADNGKDPPQIVGPLAENVAPLLLTAGTWTVSVKVGDSVLCPSEAAEALCTQQVVVKSCAEDPQDTHCDGMTVVEPQGGPFPGLYSASAQAFDDSGDEVVYTFSADNGVDLPTVIGPQKAPTASFDLGVGSWTLSAAVGDSTYCPPDAGAAAHCSQAVQVKTLSDKPNVAPLGTTSQSTGYDGVGQDLFPASNAIDGDLNTFTHTASADALSSWQDDLGDSYAIEAIQLYNRADCCAYRLRDVTVSILDLDGQVVWTSELQNPENTNPDGSGNPYNPPRLTLSLLELLGKPVDGRTVRIERTADSDSSGIGNDGSLADQDVLSLGEVRIFAAPSTLPAAVTRDLSKETFSGAETISASLAITTQAPNTPVTVTEVLPDQAKVTGISDGGVLQNNQIVWDLGPISARTLTYQVSSLSSCAGVLPYGFSTFIALGKKGKVRGESTLTRVITDQDLTTWQSADIGAAAGANEPVADHDLLISAGGNGIKGTADECRLVSTTQSGDFQLTARVDCMDDPGKLGQAGLMVRDTLEPSSAHAFFFLSSAPPAAGGVGTLKGFFRRETNASRSVSPITISVKDVTALPIYLRLARAGTKIVFQRSSDGATFQDVASKDIGTGSTQINLKSDTLAGLAVSAAGGGTSRYTFGAVTGPSFNTASPEPPTNLVAQGSSGQVTLSWNAPASGPAPTGYAIYRSATPGGPYPASPAAEVPAEEKSYIDGGLAQGSYCYVVRSRQGTKESASSNESCAQTVHQDGAFRRGDVDSNGVVEITDAVKLLGYLFLGGGTPECLEAGDTDNSGTIDITDAVTNLGYQFLGQAPPVAPGPLVCGQDPSAPMLGCQKFCE
jgi:hypothetical protein